MAGKFFPIDLDVLSRMISYYRNEEWINPIFAYLILCKHQQRGKPYTTAGAPAIAKGLGLTRYGAEKLLDELEQFTWGEAPLDRAVVGKELLKANPQEGIPPTVGMYEVKALPRIGSEIIFLPNCLLEGHGDKPPPLERLNGLASTTARFDALGLVLRCYSLHDVQGSGGIDPKRGFSGHWGSDGTSFDEEIPLGYQGSKKYKGDCWHFWLVSRKERLQGQPSLIKTVTQGDPQRFFQAVHHLKKLGLLIEVAMVFDRDPSEYSGAKPLYPLRVFDALYRENATAEKTGLGGLYSEIYNCLDRSALVFETIPAFRQMTFQEYMKTGVGSGFFVVAAPTQNAKVLSIFRLRFCAPDHDTGLGFKAEEERTTHWQRLLAQAFQD